MENKAPLDDMQFGFRNGRSTVGALQEVVRFVEDAGRDKWTGLILMDVWNAFNMANWGFIVEELRTKGIDSRLVGLVTNYFHRRRWDICRSASREVSMGVPQGSVLGPLLWNVLYDGVLRIVRPAGTKLLAYADDLAIVVADHSEVGIIQKGNIMIVRIVDRWLANRGLDLAPKKTEAVIFNARKLRTVGFHLRGKKVEIKPVIKYLGV